MQDLLELLHKLHDLKFFVEPLFLVYRRHYIPIYFDRFWGMFFLFSFQLFLQLSAPHSCSSCTDCHLYITFQTPSFFFPPTKNGVISSSSQLPCTTAISRTFPYACLDLDHGSHPVRALPTQLSAWLFNNGFISFSTPSSSLTLSFNHFLRSLSNISSRAELISHDIILLTTHIEFIHT